MIGRSTAPVTGSGHRDGCGWCFEMLELLAQHVKQSACVVIMPLLISPVPARATISKAASTSRDGRKDLDGVAGPS